LAGAPMIIFLLSVGSFVINILYSSAFIDALPILQWQLFSSFMNLIIWPLGVIYFVRNKGRYMLFSEIIKQFFYLIAIYAFWEIFGFKIFGIGFFISFFATLIFTIYSVRTISNFSFNKINSINILVLSLLVIAEFLSINLLTGYLSSISSALIFCFTTFYCLRQLNECMNLLTIFNKYKSQYFTK
jgi:O-antigen/teichoic acid export membrane protein